MRVIHVVASVDDEAAGPSVSVPRVAEAQARAGMTVSLHTVATAVASATGATAVADATGATRAATDVAGAMGGAGEPGAARPLAIPHTRHPASLAGVPVLSRLCASQAMARALRAEAPATDIVHGHGLWLMPNIYPAAMAAAGTTVVMAPRGMLGAAALQFSATKKKLFHRLVQRGALARTHLFHATSEAEVADIRAFGLTQPVAMVPNGVALPDLADPPGQTGQPGPAGETGEAAGGPLPADGRPTVLSLGRIHPKKGLDRLVRAFALLDRPDWRLRIVGPSEVGHGDELRALAGSLGLTNVTIEAPLFGADKLAAYRGAAVFALPTQHENFAMTVAEALAAGTPVISTVGAPWEGLEREGCGRWIDHGPEPMAAALGELMALSPAERAAMGARGRAWMARDFSWDSIGARLGLAYAWARHGGPAPDSIRFADPTTPADGHTRNAQTRNAQSFKAQSRVPHTVKET